MTDNCCGEGCGCHADSFYTDKKCPDCGRLLRAAGNPQRIQYRLVCFSCGYQSHELSVEEVREAIG